MVYNRKVQQACSLLACYDTTGLPNKKKQKSCEAHHTYSNDIGHINVPANDIYVVCSDTTYKFGNDTLNQVETWHPTGRPFRFCPRVAFLASCAPERAPEREGLSHRVCS